MKKMTLKQIFGVTGLVLVTSLAVAEANQPIQSENNQGLEFDALDKDQDGVLSAAEASNSTELSVQWTNVDADGSGSIDRAEFSAFETEEIKDKEYDQSAPEADKEKDMQ